MPRHSQPKRVRKDAVKQDETYRRIVKAFVDLLTQQGYVAKDEVLKEAEATAWATLVRWAYVVDFVTTEYPGVVLLALTWRYFASPRNKAAHSVEPGKYIAPNYTTAAGFASVAQFVQAGARNLAIAQAKYSQQQIAAARAIDTAERFNAMLSTAPALAMTP